MKKSLQLKLLCSALICINTIIAHASDLPQTQALDGSGKNLDTDPKASGDFGSHEANSNQQMANTIPPNFGKEKGIFTKIKDKFLDIEKKGKKLMSKAVDIINRVRANSGFFDIEKQQIGLLGNVKINMDGYSIRANSIVYDIKSKNIYAEGNVVFKKGKKILASTHNRVLLNTQKSELFASKVMALLDEKFLVYMNKMKATEKGINIRNTKLTSYLNMKEKADWYMSADNVRLNRETNSIEFDSVVLRVLDIPIFYFPTLSMHNLDAKRSYGFINPSLYYDNVLGITANLPFYIPINEKVDITINPLISLNSGALLVKTRIYPNKNQFFSFDTSLPLWKRDKVKDQLTSDKYFRAMGKFKMSANSELGYQWTFADSAQLLKSYRLQNSLIIKNQAYLSTSSSWFDEAKFLAMQIKDQNLWWNKEGEKKSEYVIPLAQVFKFSSLESLNKNLQIESKIIGLVGRQILKRPSVQDKETSFAIGFSRTLLRYNAFSNSQMGNLKLSLGMISRLTHYQVDNAASGPSYKLTTSPVFGLDWSQTMLQKGFLFQPFIVGRFSTDYDDNYKDNPLQKVLKSRDLIKQVNPFLELPNLQKASLSETGDNVIAGGLEIKKFYKGSRLFATPAAIKNQKSTFIGGSFGIISDHFQYKGAVSYKNANKSFRIDNGVYLYSTKRNYLGFQATMESEKDKKGKKYFMAKFQKAINKRLSVNGRLQASADQVKNTLLGIGVTYKGRGIKLKGEAQMDQKGKFTILLRLDLNQLVGFSTNIIP